MKSQLWVVTINGFATRRFLPYAKTEKEAVRLWQENDGQNILPRALRAIPRDVERVTTALVLARELANTLCDEKANINHADFRDSVEYSLAELGFLDEAREASSTWADELPPKDPALAIVQNMALMFRGEDAEVDSVDFLDFVTRELDQAGFLAEARARAEPERAIDDAAVPHSAGTRGHRAPTPSQRPEELSAEEQAALLAWADDHAPRWKAALRDAWDTGNYGGSENDSALQRIRNRLGPSWLVKYRLPVDPSQETTGYRCWVRTSIAPNDTRVWVATRRPDAVAQVKTAVRNHNSEGGVESKDPEKPFEVTFAMESGKLITTKHTD